MKKHAIAVDPGAATRPHQRNRATTGRFDDRRSDAVINVDTTIRRTCAGCQASDVNRSGGRTHRCRTIEVNTMVTRSANSTGVAKQRHGACAGRLDASIGHDKDAEVKTTAAATGAGDVNGAPRYNVCCSAADFDPPTFGTSRASGTSNRDRAAGRHDCALDVHTGRLMRRTGEARHVYRTGCAGQTACRTDNDICICVQIDRTETNHRNCRRNIDRVGVDGKVFA